MCAEAIPRGDTQEARTKPPEGGADRGVLYLHHLAEEEPATQQPVVLVVDDDIFVCRAVACILREARCVRVYAARDGQEALDLAGQILPALIILDLKMPGPPAAEVCRALRAVPGLEHTRICVLTGVLAEAEVMQDLRPYINRVLTKPPDPRALVALVDGV